MRVSVSLLAAIVVITICPACTRSSRAQTNSRFITVLMWTAGASTNIDTQLIRDFERHTGISIHLVPAAESSSLRLEQEQRLLESRSHPVDVLQVDTVWIPQFADRLSDLRPDLADEIGDELPGTIANATVDGKIAAAPFMVGYGLLYYRTDLLRKYGFAHPPVTWTELEKQALRIQQGERAAGRADFWGYVWQGLAYEGLTCDALEWQSSQGGGNFVVPGPAAHVDNPQTIKAFARATHWIGTISPPGVVAYVEEDARNVWQSGNAAFLRNWGYAYALAKADPRVSAKFDVGPMPYGNDMHSAALGGWYLAVAQASTKQSDAAAFVRFMTSQQAQLKRAEYGYWPTLNSAYSKLTTGQNRALFEVVQQSATRAVRRPSTLLRGRYACASTIYARGVHEVLMGRYSAAAGAERIQQQLDLLLRAPANARQESCQ